MTIKYSIETHFSLVLILACIAGLILPGMPLLPNESSVLVLALLMFLSCYKLRDGGFSSIRWRGVALFYALRYVFLPLPIWLLADMFLPQYAIAVFLLALLPAAISSPAMTGIYGGAMPAAFTIVILSQILTPFLIPLEFSWLGGVDIAPAPGLLMETLVWAVLAPMAVYALARKHQKSADYLYRQNKFFSILLIAFVIALAIAKQRDVILANPEAALEALAVALVCFAAFLLVGWAAGWRKPREERIAFATCSSFNNTAIGVSLALMYFGPETALFIATSQVGWALLPAMMRLWLKWDER